MKWEGQDLSSKVEDRRSEGGGDGGGRSGGMPRLGGRGIGLGSIVIALVAGWIFGINPLTVLGLLSGGDLQAPPGANCATSQDNATCPRGQSGGFRVYRAARH